MEGHLVRVECCFSISRLGSTSPVVYQCACWSRGSPQKWWLLPSGWAGVPRITFLSPWVSSARGDEGIKGILYLLPFGSHTVCGHPALLSECQPLSFSHRDLLGSYFGVRKPRKGGRGDRVEGPLLPCPRSVS